MDPEELERGNDKLIDTRRCSLSQETRDFCLEIENMTPNIRNRGPRVCARLYPDHDEPRWGLGDIDVGEKRVASPSRRVVFLSISVTPPYFWK